MVLGVPILEHFRINKERKTVQAIFFETREDFEMSLFELWRVA